MATKIVASLKKDYLDEIHSGDNTWYLNHIVDYCDNYITDIDIDTVTLYSKLRF